MTWLDADSLSRFIVIVTTAFSMAALLAATVGAAREIRIRPAFEWGRIAVGVGGTMMLGIIVGVHTPVPYALVAISGGAIAGFVQGRQMIVSIRGTKLWAKRATWGIVLWTAGLVGMQLAGLGSRTGIFRIGQAIALFSVSAGLGVILGRRTPERVARSGGAALATVLAIAGMTYVSPPRLAGAQGDEIDLLTGEIQVTLTWSGTADLDLYVQEPGGSTIFYLSESGSQGGQLSHDSNAGCLAGSGAFVENIAWASGTPSGSFRIWVQNYSQCTEDLVGSQGFRLEIRAGGVVEVVDTGILSDSALSNPVVIQVNNINVPVPEIVSAEGGENLDVDPPQTGDGSRPTEVDESGNLLEGNGTGSDPNGGNITPGEAVGASIAAAAAAAAMAGLTIAEGGRSLTDLFTNPVASPPSTSGTGWVISDNDDGTRTRVDLASDGSETTTRLDRNGSVIDLHVSSPRPTGTGTLVGTNADGSTSTIDSHQDGSTTETSVAPDGSTIDRDPQGAIDRAQPLPSPPSATGTPDFPASTGPPLPTVQPAQPDDHVEPTPPVKPRTHVEPTPPVKPGISDARVAVKGALLGSNPIPKDATAGIEPKDLSNEIKTRKDQLDRFANTLSGLKSFVSDDKVLSPAARKAISSNLEAASKEVRRVSDALGKVGGAVDQAQALLNARETLQAGVKDATEFHEKALDNLDGVPEGAQRQASDLSTAVLAGGKILGKVVDTFVPGSKQLGFGARIDETARVTAKTVQVTVKNLKRTDTELREHGWESEKDAAMTELNKRMELRRAKRVADARAKAAEHRKKHGPTMTEWVQELIFEIDPEEKARRKSFH